MDYPWISVPANTMLESKLRWASLGNNRFAALRHLLLVVEQDAKIKNGPIVQQMDWPVNSKFSYQDKKKNVIKYTAGISESITSTITQQLSTQVISKVNSGLNAGKVLSATLSAEVQEKVDNQLTESLSQVLSMTKTFEIQEENEITQTLEFTVPKSVSTSDTRKVSVYNKIREIKWDIYLYQSDYLQLEHHSHWLWGDIRKTIKTDAVQLKKPLFTIVFYEPITTFSYAFDNYEPDINDITKVNIEKIDNLCPTKRIPDIQSLEELAKIAFPVTRKEKRVAKAKETQQTKSPRVPISHGVQKRPSAKKAAPKRTARKTAPKKAAKEASPRRMAKKSAKR